MSLCTLYENVAPGTCRVCEAELARLVRIEKAAREFFKTATGPNINPYIAFRDALEWRPVQGPDAEKP